MRVALVHDYLVQDGGAERVLEILKRIWPEAPIFVLFHEPSRVGDNFRGYDIRTSFLQRLPFARYTYKGFLPLMPMATEQHDLKDFDLVISSSSAFAKGIITRPETLHVCYCHTPTRYLWSDTHSYVHESGLPFPLKKLMPVLLSRLRIWDHHAANRVDRFIANSDTVKRRIAKYYQRDSEVIYPPVETGRYTPSNKIGNYYLAGGRLVPYKRFDIIVRAFNKLGLPLKIFGEGPEMKRLKQEAKPNIEFLGKVSEADKAELYREAIAYLHPQEEDFGITPVEAMASGRPVIAYGKGGATETIIPGITGEFIGEQSWEELANTIIRFQPEKYQSEQIRAHALNFSVDNFVAKMKKFTDEEWRKWQQ